MLDEDQGHTFCARSQAFFFQMQFLGCFLGREEQVTHLACITGDHGTVFETLVTTLSCSSTVWTTKLGRINRPNGAHFLM